MKPKAIFVAIIAIVSGIADFSTVAAAADFCDDGCLRMDYIFSGKSGEDIDISLLKVLKQKDSRVALNGKKLPLAGNGQITVVKEKGGDTIYSQSFSSLFQEWLELGDATSRAFENSFLIPYTHEKLKVSLKLFDSRHNILDEHSTVIDPDDILIRPVVGNVPDTVWIHRGSYQDGPKIGVAILAEGYTLQEMADFEAKAREAVDAIKSHEPFKTYADRFDFIAVKSPSIDSGVSIPKENIWKNTVFGSHFSTFYSDRYLTTPNVFSVYDAMASTPCQHIIILANTDTYGGGGIYNAYTLTAANNPLFRPVVVHEFGHSFGGLADEYFYQEDVMNDTYPLDVEPWEPNITTFVDFKSKWKDMLAEGTEIKSVQDVFSQESNKPKQVGPVGLFEGAAYSTHGIYRPSDYCRMRVNDVDSFCPVCEAAIERLILFYTNPEVSK